MQGNGTITRKACCRELLFAFSQERLLYAVLINKPLAYTPPLNGYIYHADMKDVTEAYLTAFLEKAEEVEIGLMNGWRFNMVLTDD